jgi:ABC-type nickel/cobalt efflux system permease component RcnA
MDKAYFLIFVGVLSLALVAWLVTTEWRRKLKAKKQKSTTHAAAQAHHRHGRPVRHVLPSRTTSLPPRHIGAFEQRHQRAGEEMRHGSAITAERVFSDEEIPDHEQTHGLEMTAIRFVPEDAADSPVSRASQPRR